MSDFLTQFQTRIQSKLESTLSLPSPENRLIAAMKYAVLNGGKRLRPMLVYATGFACGGELDVLDSPAIAVELIHCYSLIHDDLPAMDDDDLRRGKPTCHKAFDEATAILAGDALLTLAFEIMADIEEEKLAPTVILQMIKVLAHASGGSGMALGQSLDLLAEGKQINIQELENIHSLKTGALIRTSVQLGVLCARCQDQAILRYLDEFGRCLGLAFQIQNDILNLEGDMDEIGRMSGTDLVLNKATYPSIANLKNAKERVSELHQQALLYLDKIPKNVEMLKELLGYLGEG